MESDEAVVLQLELKYCERCGGLWLRVRDKQDIYCSPCAAAMSEVAISYRSKRPPRLPIHNIKSQHATTFPMLLRGGQA